MAKDIKQRGMSKPSAKPATTLIINSTIEVSKSKPDSSTAQRRLPRTSFMSSEFVGDSDDDSDAEAKVKNSSSSDIAVPEVKSVVAKKWKRQPMQEKEKSKSPISIRSDSSDSSDESVSKDDSQEYGSREKIISEKKSDGGSGSDGSEEESSDSTDESSKSSSSSTPPQTKEEDSRDFHPQKAKAPISHASEVRPASAFQPHHDYKPLNTTTTSKTAEFFRPQNTEGKQIWYITAPANVPISSLQEIAMKKLFNGDTVVTHSELEYSFMADNTTSATTAVLLPSETGYNALPTEIKTVLHLRQVVRLSTAPQSRARLQSNSTASFPEPHAAARPKKIQPKGLRMRYRPPGAGTGDIGAIGSSDSDVPASSRLEMSSSTTASSKKRKEREDDTISKEKKKKKNKHQEEQNNGDETAASKPSKEGSKKNKESSFSSIKANGDARENGLEETKKIGKERRKKKRNREEVQVQPLH